MKFGNYTIYLFCVLLFFNSCAKNKFQQDPLTDSERIKIKRIAVVVDTKNKFYVRYPAESLNIKSVISNTAFYASAASVYIAFFAAPIPFAISALTYGIVGFKFKNGNDRSPTVYKIDHIQTWQFKKYVKNYNPDKQLSNIIVEKTIGNSDISVTDNKSGDDLELLKSKGFENLLILTIDQWGLYVCYNPLEWKEYLDSCDFNNIQSLTGPKKCNKPSPSNKLRAGIKISSKLISLDNKKKLYHYQYHYFNPECKNSENFPSVMETVVESLNNTLENVASNTIKEVNINK